MNANAGLVFAAAVLFAASAQAEVCAEAAWGGTDVTYLQCGSGATSPAVARASTDVQGRHLVRANHAKTKPARTSYRTTAQLKSRRS